MTVTQSFSLPKQTLLNVLKDYQVAFETKLNESLSLFATQSTLREACTYALLNGGKRFRPALVMAIAKALGNGYDASDSALAVEFFHTASLIADDLPSMDDDDMRRDKPSLHKVYGEATALLASYALIAAGYGCIARNVTTLNACYPERGSFDHLCVKALENASFNTGVLGATGGQHLDLYPPDLKFETLKEIIHKKTISLFEVAFVLGWLFGGGDPEKISLVKKAASHFGMAFQLADDLSDMQQDMQNEHSVNVANLLGSDHAKKCIQEELDAFRGTLRSLSLHSPELEQLANLIST